MLPDPRSGDIRAWEGGSPLLRGIGIPSRERSGAVRMDSVLSPSRILKARFRYEAAPLSPETVYSMLAPYTPALIVEPSTLHWAK
jgi:hypothetical protein